MFCISCGKETDIKVRKCIHCGFDLTHIQKLIENDEPEEDDVEDEFRTAKECAIRCVVLYCVVAAGNGENKSRIISWLKEQNLWNATSPEEKDFLTTRKPERSQVINATWRIEALSVLLWALEKVKSATDLSESCDVSEVQAACRFFLKDAADFINFAHLRDEAEVEDLYEEIYQAHWEIRDAQIHNRPAPDEYISGVVMERHYALNWLTGYLSQDWDDITTDT